MAYLTLNPRRLALTTLLVILFTGSMIWLHRDDAPLGYARYEKYGFSLSYPKLMSLREVGLSDMGLGPDPSDFSGLIQCQSLWENKLDVFEVIWFVKTKAPSAEAELLDFLRVASKAGSVVKSVGEYYVTTFRGRAMSCINIEVEEAGYTFSGIIGVVYRPWTSPGVERTFFIAYLTFKGVATEEQIHADLQTYMGGLSI